MKEIVDNSVFDLCQKIIEDGKKAQLHFYNIKEGKPGNKPGFWHLKSYVAADTV